MPPVRYREYFSWSVKATKALILARKRYNNLFSGKGGLSVEAWKKISKEIGVPMNKCNLKWKNLVKTYRGMIKEREPRSSWRYFDLMESVLGKKKSYTTAQNTVKGSDSHKASPFISSVTHSDVEFYPISVTIPSVLPSEPEKVEEEIKDIVKQFTIDDSVYNSAEPSERVYVETISGCSSPVFDGTKYVLKTLDSPMPLEILPLPENPIISLDSSPEHIPENSPKNDNCTKGGISPSYSFTESCHSDSEDNDERFSSPTTYLPPKTPFPSPSSSSGSKSYRKSSIKKKKMNLPFDSLLYDMMKKIRKDIKEQTKMRHKIMELAQILIDNHKTNT